MLRRLGVATLVVGLLTAACGSAAPSQAPTGTLTQTPTGPSSQAPADTQSPPQTPAPTNSVEPTDGTEPGSTESPGTEPLPDPELGVDEIVAGFGQPGMATQIVVSMLDALGIGLYHDDGTEIRPGLEQSDADYYAFESEALGLIQMVNEQDDPELQLSWEEYRDGLAEIGFPGTTEDLLEAYSSAYAARPDPAITQFVLANADMDIDGRITPLGVWLLWLDGVVGGSLASEGTARTFAFAGGGPIAQGGFNAQQAGVAWSNLQRAWNQLAPQREEALRRTRMMTLIKTTTIEVQVHPPDVHEGHGGFGTTATIEAIVKPCGGNSPFTGTCSMPPNPVLSGIPVLWKYPNSVTEHGVATAASGRTKNTGTDGKVSFTYTPIVEASNGRGDEKSVDAPIEGSVSKIQVAEKIWQMPMPPKAAAVFMGKGAYATHISTMTIEWHEEAAAAVKIVWADVYNGVEDEFTFEGKLDKIVTGPECIGGEAVTCLTGTGTVNGDRAGWVGCNPGLEGQIFSGPAKATFNGVIIGDKITISAFADFMSALSGINSGPMEVPLSGGTFTIQPPSRNNLPTPRPSGAPVGELCPRYSFGTLTLNKIDAPL